LAHWGQRILAWVSLLRQQFGIAGTILGLVGIWQHAEHQPRQFAGLVLTFAIYSIYAIGYNVTDSYVYLLPVYFLYAMWIGRGSQSLLMATDRAQGSRMPRVTALLGVALIALPFASLRANLPTVDLSGDYEAYNFGSEVFAQLPAQSLVITANDPHTFTLWYFARVVMQRSDVAVLDRDLLGYDWYVRGLRQSYPWICLPQLPFGDLLSLDRLLEANMESSVIFLTEPDKDLMSRYSFREKGLLYRLAAD
jgi:hypothetical protein